MINDYSITREVHSHFINFKSMLISLLIANYNNSRFLKNVISIVYAQSFTDWEIIIVDDGSTDGFEEIIAPYKDDKKIKVFRNGENMGCAYTKRRCTDEAAGDIMAFFDPDDILAPDALQIMHDAHLEKPSCSIIHSTHYICDDEMNIIRIAEYPKALPADTPLLLLGDGSVHHFATFKTSCYDRTTRLSPIKAYDKAVDMELYYLLEEEGDIFFIDKPLYYYRIHSGSISNWGNEGKAKLAHYQIIEEACLRRIRKLKKNPTEDSGRLIKRYRTRYHKISILHNFRRRNWPRFVGSLVIFPFVGGMENMISYFKKLPTEGFSLLQKSFVKDPSILK